MCISSVMISRSRFSTTEQLSSTVSALSGMIACALCDDAAPASCTIACALCARPYCRLCAPVVRANATAASFCCRLCNVTVALHSKDDQDTHRYVANPCSVRARGVCSFADGDDSVSARVCTAAASDRARALISCSFCHFSACTACAATCDDDSMARHHSSCAIATTQYVLEACRDYLLLNN